MPIDPTTRAAAHRYLDDNEVPEGLDCEISYDLLRRPVYLDDPRHVYEEAHIRRWLAEGGIHPLLQAPVDNPVLHRHEALQARVMRFRHGLFHAHLERGENAQAAKLALENAFLRRAVRCPPAPVALDSPWLTEAKSVVALAEQAAAQGGREARIGERLARQGTLAARRAETLVDGIEIRRRPTRRGVPWWHYRPLPPALSTRQLLPLFWRQLKLSAVPTEQHLSDLLAACAAANIAPDYVLTGSGVIVDLLEGGYVKLAHAALRHVEPGEYGEYKYKMPDASGAAYTGPSYRRESWCRTMSDRGTDYTVSTYLQDGAVEWASYMADTGQPYVCSRMQNGRVQGAYGTGQLSYAGQFDTEGHYHGLGVLTGEAPVGTRSGLFQHGEFVHGTVEMHGGIHLAGRSLLTEGFIGGSGGYTGHFDTQGQPRGLGQLSDDAHNYVLTGSWDHDRLLGPGAWDMEGTRYHAQFRPVADARGEIRQEALAFDEGAARGFVAAHTRLLARIQEQEALAQDAA